MSRKTIKVFVNNLPLIFLGGKDHWKNHPNTDCWSQRTDEFIDRVIKEKESFTDPLKGHGSCFLSKVLDTSEVIGRLCKTYNYIEAAGGLVLNDKGKVLMIHRLGFWDLPKGKIDQGETPRKTAIREIKEECGIGKLKIIKELPSTYHIYEMKGTKYLKRTYWFKMICNDDTKPVPQVEENIDEVRWMSRTRMKRINSRNTYLSILDVLESLKK